MSGPLVSVLTPVYNGAAHLPACVESVLAQTYPDWEYVIADNASTDETGELARRYAAGDARIRVLRNPRTVTAIANHNIAARAMSSASRYCKFVHADDWLFPECLARMVDVAERHPSVGVVSAYRLKRGRVDLQGVPASSPVVPGRRICRQSLLGGPYVFGSPTSVLFRSDLVARRPDFYDGSTIHADEAACYELLRESDFGFVHQVLTYTRVHEASMTSRFADRMDSYYAGALIMLRRYGAVYLTAEEYRERLRFRLDQYYRCLARAAARRRERAFWDYHRAVLAGLGYPLSRQRLLRGALAEALAHAPRLARALGRRPRAAA